MDKDYIKLFEDELKLKIKDVTKTSSQKQEIECLRCSNIFDAIPKAKMAAYQKSNLAGCPKCTLKEKYNLEKNNYVFLIEQKFNILSDLNLITNTKVTIKVENKNCKHIFESVISNLLYRDVNCPICNTKRKSEYFKEINHG